MNNTILSDAPGSPKRSGFPAPCSLPRDLPEAEQDVVWQQLGLLAKLGLRKSPVGVRLATPKGKSRVAKTGGGVTLTGEPVELALWVGGRRGPAQVAVTGSQEAIDAFLGRTPPRPLRRREHKWSSGSTRRAGDRTRGRGTRWAGRSRRSVGIERIRAGEPRVVVLEKTPVPGTKMNAELLLGSCDGAR
jgi:hypothetical protein